MDGKDEVFEAFVDANDLELVPAFREGVIKYSRLHERPTNKEELMNTVGFAGFVDGYEGHHHRNRGPRGTPDPVEDKTSLSEMVGSAVAGMFVESSDKLSPVDRKYVVKLETLFTNQTYSETDEGRYDEQFDLGRQCRGS